MNNKVKQLMIYINNHGYECYIIGGYVRDYLLNIISTDYDLCTNAPLNILLTILKNYQIKTVNYGTLVIIIDDLEVEITTYRKELEYYKRKPIKYEFVNTLEEDIIRRDFTINTICLDSHNNIVDKLDGLKDLNNKIIRCVGDINQKLIEDPLRILRAIRFSAYLNFKLDEKLELGISKYKHLLRNLSYERKKEEINKLIKIKRLDILIKYDLVDWLELDLSKYSYFNSVILTWIMIDKNNKYLFTKKERTIKNKVIELNSLGLTSYNIYKYGLDISLLVGELNNINVLKLYNLLPIKNRKEINIISKDIMKLFEDKKIIRHIYEDLEFKIINHELINSYDEIMSYLRLKKHTI